MHYLKQDEAIDYFIIDLQFFPSGKMEEHESNESVQYAGDQNETITEDCS